MYAHAYLVAVARQAYDHGRNDERNEINARMQTRGRALVDELTQQLRDAFNDI